MKISNQDAPSSCDSLEILPIILVKAFSPILAYGQSKLSSQDNDFT